MKTMKPWVMVMTAVVLLAGCGKREPVSPGTPDSSVSAAVEGKITALDDVGILVVSPSKEEGANPRAIWMKISVNSEIVDGSTGEAMKAADLAIGYGVLAWADGPVMESYPEQTGLARLEVTSKETGNGDLQGNITRLAIGIEDTSQREIEIDGKSFRLSQSAVIRIGDQEAAFEDLKEGDRAQVWFSGYEVGPGEKMITQVMVTL